MIATTSTVILLSLTGTAAVVAGLSMGLTRRRRDPGTRVGLSTDKNLGKR